MRVKRDNERDNNIWNMSFLPPIAKGVNMAHQYCRKGAIKNWDEGLALGNGEVGAMLWGGWDRLNISLDRGDVWDTAFSPEDTPEFNLKTILQCKDNDDNARLRKVFDEPYFKASPTKLPMGRLVVKLPKGYSRRRKRTQTLDLDKSQATVSVGDMRLQVWLHATERVGIIRSQDDIELQIGTPEFGILGKDSPRLGKGVSNRLKDIVFKAPEQIDREITCGENRYCISIAYQNIKEQEGFAIVVAHRVDNSKEFAFYAEKIDETIGFDAIIFRVCNALEQGLSALEQSHLEWWKEYWNKSSIHIDNELLERGWYFHNYLLGAGSRKGNYPMPLQGLWTADDGVHLPPWKGDYHHDLNTELMYSSYLKANRLEQGENFLDYLFSLKDRGEEFARKFYGVDGLCLPSVMDINGRALGGWAMYSLSPTNQLWLCQLFESYYTYTNDKEFLQNICYPYMQRSMQTIENLLQEKDGKLVLPFSSSPEIHDNTMKAFLPFSNYDLSLIRYVASALARLSEELDKEQQVKRYCDLLSKLDDLYVDSDGVLLICKGEKLQHSHRHFSNAMAIYPLRLLNPDIAKDRRIIDATIQSYRDLGTSEWTGYSFAIFAQLLIIAGHADEAQNNLEIFHKYFCLPNGLHCNGDYKRKGYSKLHYRPFTLEGNFCAQEAVQEMLLHCDGDRIRVFPCVPKSWKYAEFETLRACHGVLVSANMVGGEIQEITLRAEQDCKIILGNDLKNMTTENESLINGRITLKAGQIIRIFKNTKPDRK